jgi:hypothetical protein
LEIQNNGFTTNSRNGVAVNGHWEKACEDSDALFISSLLYEIYIYLTRKVIPVVYKGLHQVIIIRCNIVMFASTQMQMYSDTNFNLILIITLDDEDMIFVLNRKYGTILLYNCNNIDALLFHVILIWT